MLPAPGQGALAVTVRAGDGAVHEAVRGAVHDTPTALQVAAERAFLRRLEGGCQVPVAAYAERQGDGGSRLLLRGRVISLDGQSSDAGQEAGELLGEREAESLGTALAEVLLARGAAKVLTEARDAAAPSVTEP